MDYNPRRSRQPSLAPSGGHEASMTMDSNPADKKRERKRETDRAAQREHRKRQKLYVEELEARLEAMKSNNESDQVAALLQENERLRQELNHYKKSFASIESIVTEKRRRDSQRSGPSPKEESNDSEMDDNQSSLSFSAQPRSLSVTSAHSRASRRPTLNEYPVPYVDVYAHDTSSSMVSSIGGMMVSSPDPVYTSMPEQMALSTPGMDYQNWNMPVYSGSMDSGMSQMAQRHTQTMRTSAHGPQYNLNVPRDSRSGSRSRQDTPDLQHYPHPRRQ